MKLEFAGFPKTKERVVGTEPEKPINTAPMPIRTIRREEFGLNFLTAISIVDTGFNTEIPDHLSPKEARKIAVSLVPRGQFEDDSDGTDEYEAEVRRVSGLHQDQNAETIRVHHESVRGSVARVLAPAVVAEAGLEPKERLQIGRTSYTVAEDSGALVLARLVSDNGLYMFTEANAVDHEVSTSDGGSMDGRVFWSSLSRELGNAAQLDVFHLD